ncbi:MAG: YkgJ family cysteine cluster protein [Dehalococcoidia bacterium]|nr:YkgJ family cysteine cluster protein [Dehalococcoidia bacterium]
MDCFRCGVCCQSYQPCLSLREAGRVARRLGMDLNRFRKEYADQRWPGEGNLLLRKRGEACVFLDRVDERVTSCRIHDFRPKACREWQADLTRRECIEGLKFWGLGVGKDGRISGPPRAIREFEAFLASLSGEKGIT